MQISAKNNVLKVDTNSWDCHKIGGESWRLGNGY